MFRAPATIALLRRIRNSRHGEGNVRAVIGYQ